MTIIVLLMYVIDAAMTFLYWKATLDLLLLGYGLVILRSRRLEARLNAGDWDSAGERPASTEDERQLALLEEQRNFGRNLDGEERSFVAKHKLAGRPIRELWLLFATRAVQTNWNGVAMSRCLDWVYWLGIGAWVAAATVFTIGAHFGVHGAHAWARLGWLPVELIPVAFVAYFFDLYLTHPYRVARALGLRN